MANNAKDNCNKLHEAEYPGRAILMGLTPSGRDFVQLYWTMGRSENSKNRILVKKDGFVKTVPKFETKEMIMKNLIIYNISYQVGNYHIISNGVQTDTIVEYLSEDKTFEAALSQWKHEDDPPILTPRISGIAKIDSSNHSYTYQFGIIKSDKDNPEHSSMHIHTYRTATPGQALCIHTYDLSQVCSSFSGEPYPVLTFNDIDEMTDYYWELISPDYRVGLYTKYINLEDGSVKERLYNRPAEGII